MAQLNGNEVVTPTKADSALAKEPSQSLRPTRECHSAWK